MPTIYTAANDGVIYGYTGQAWPVPRNRTIGYYTNGTLGSWYAMYRNSNYCMRTFFAFDTSGISVVPASATISFYCSTNVGTNSSILVKSTAPIDLSTGLANSNFDDIVGLVGSQSMAGNVTDYSNSVTSWATNNWIVHTLTAAALSDIASMNVFKVCMVNYSDDYLYSTPSSGNYCQINFQQGTNDPKLDYVAGQENDPPTVSSISPNSGPTTGGTSVTITGTDFIATPSVTIGGTAATGESFTSSTTITATTPAHVAGAVTVGVMNPDAQSDTLSNSYTYVNVDPPAVSSISPTTGSTLGGTSVTITGTDFINGASIAIGGVSVTGVSFVDSTSLTGTTGARSAGLVDVVVTNPDPASQTSTLSDGFTYIAPPAPSISSINPSRSFSTGGRGFTLTGANFASGATITLGGVSATSVSFVNSTTLTGTTGARSAGLVDIVVTNADAQNDTESNGFEYLPAFGASGSGRKIHDIAYAGGAGGSFTIHADDTDGTCRAGASTWDTVHDATSAGYSYTSTTGYIGVHQSYQPNSCNSASTYYVYRAFIAFDTSGVTGVPFSGVVKLYSRGYAVRSTHGIIGVKATGPDLSTEVSNASYNDLDGYQAGFNNTHLTAYTNNVTTSWGSSGYQSFTLTAAALSDMASQNVFQICFMSHDFDYLDDAPYNCTQGTFGNGEITMFDIGHEEYSSGPELYYTVPSGTTYSSVNGVAKGSIFTINK